MKWSVAVHSDTPVFSNMKFLFFLLHWNEILPHYKRSGLCVCSAWKTEFSERKCNKPSPEIKHGKIISIFYHLCAHMHAFRCKHLDYMSLES